jgi:hypothetical protein
MGGREAPSFAIPDRAPFPPALGLPKSAGACGLRCPGQINGTPLPE